MNASSSSTDKDQDHSAAAASRQKQGGGGSGAVAPAAGHVTGTGNSGSSVPAIFTPSSSSSMSWLRLKDPRIVRASRAFGGKDRHSKVCTVRGLRDRRVRLSVPTAIQLYDLQDRLGLSQPSKVVDWLLNAAKDDIDELPPLQIPPADFIRTSLLSLNKAAAAGINRSNTVRTSSTDKHHHHHDRNVDDGEDHGFLEMSNNLWGIPLQLQQDERRRKMMMMMMAGQEKEKVQLQHIPAAGGFLGSSNNILMSQMNYHHGTTTIFQYPLEPSSCTQLSASQLAQASGGGGNDHASSTLVAAPLPLPFSLPNSSGSHHHHHRHGLFLCTPSLGIGQQVTPYNTISSQAAPSNSTSDHHHHSIDLKQLELLGNNSAHSSQHRSTSIISTTSANAQFLYHPITSESMATTMTRPLLGFGSTTSSSPRLGLAQQHGLGFDHQDHTSTRLRPS